MKLLFGVHLHQPVDNFKEAIDEAVNKCYKPFFEVMKDYPEFKFSFHSSGWILDYLKQNYPEIIENIKKCNIEFFTGGYYEPILSIIPYKSQKTQIKKLNKFLFDEFNTMPKGLWLTERVWDYSIIKAIKKNNIKYMIVDDTHIFSSNKNNIEGYYWSEDEIALFPINKNLRYKLPFSKVEEAITEIKKYKTAIMFDDIEKFGLWPTTYEWVYNKNWLREFVEAVLNDEEIKTCHFEEYYKENESLGLVYPELVSYDEMNEWAGGNFKKFFLKYSESNRLHKRMLEFKHKDDENLYKLQTNDVFWHGVFGGIYLPSLRDNAYKYLLLLEDEKYIKLKDFLLQGYNQLKISNEKMIMIFSQKGGSLIEFSDKNKLFNYQNTLTRRKEKYHDEIISQSNDEVTTIHNQAYHFDKSKLIFDSYEKVSFIDHLNNESYADKIYNLNNFTFSYKEITKKIEILENGFSFKININKENKNSYILEFNLHFAHYHNKFILIEDNNIVLIDEWLKNNIKISFNQQVNIKYEYIKTYSKAEKGVDSIIQGISIKCEFEFNNILNLEGKICLK